MPKQTAADVATKAVFFSACLNHEPASFLYRSCSANNRQPSTHTCLSLATRDTQGASRQDVTVGPHSAVSNVSSEHDANSVTEASWIRVSSWAMKPITARPIFMRTLIPI